MIQEIDLFEIVGRAPSQSYDQSYDIGADAVEIRPAPGATFEQGCHAMLMDLIRRIGAGEIVSLSFTAIDANGVALNGVTFREQGAPQ